jgi:ADP-ribosylglycohydrolase
MDESARNHARGALLGLAVGDALGTTYEFEAIDQPAYPALAEGPATEIVGGGPFGLAAGQVTDDTQMAVCIARSVLARTGAAFDRIDMADLATRYVAWTEHAFDIGNQTAAALRLIEQGSDIASAGRKVWHASGRRAAGNGSLMRTAPIGVLFGLEHRLDDELERLVEAALTDSLITHADPRCAIACAMYDATIACCIAQHGDPLGAARRALEIAADRRCELWHADRDDVAAVDAARLLLATDLEAARGPDPGVYGGELDVHRTAGFVRVAFRLAFWHFLHTPSWRDAVIDVASRGGDADTNAAIVGALLGARDGAAAIPSGWIECVLAATQPGPAAWADAHHPKHLLPVA